MPTRFAGADTIAVPVTDPHVSMAAATVVAPRMTGVLIVTTAAEATRRAHSAGIAAAWIGDCSATIILSRLNGPHDGVVPEAVARQCGLVGPPPWRLAEPGVRAAVYAHMLTVGTNHDCYRWINLVDLASVWHRMDLGEGVRAEWGGVLGAAGLLP